MPIGLVRQKVTHPHHGYLALSQHIPAAAAVMDANRTVAIWVIVPKAKIEIPAGIIGHLYGVREGTVRCLG